MTKPVVIDNGSLLSKSGFGGENLPRSVIPTIIGRPKLQISSSDENHSVKDYYTGKEAVDLRGILKFGYPVEHGIVNDWSAVEKIWHHIFFDELEIDPSLHPVLLTEPPLNPRANREKAAEILFETFDCPRVYLKSTATLALHACDLLSGVVVDIGDTCIFVTPIIEGFMISHSIYRLDIGGRDITGYLLKLLATRGEIKENGISKEQAKEYKEKKGYVCLEGSRELARHEKRLDTGKEYILPGGESVIIGPERFLAPELLFNPAILGREIDGLGETIINSIMVNSIDIRRDLCNNIVLSGGSSLFPGLKERIHKELTEHFPENVQIGVVAEPDREHASWIGGSIVTSLPEFRDSWVTRKEYLEEGSKIISRCF